MTGWACSRPAGIGTDERFADSFRDALGWALATSRMDIGPFLVTLQVMLWPSGTRPCRFA